INESPLFHSSASRPLRRKSPSEPLLPPLVAELRRAIAPYRTADAPAADCTSLGLMTSGSVTLSTSETLQAASASVPTTASGAAQRSRKPRERIVIWEVIGGVILEADGEAEHVVRRRPERLEFRRSVARCRKCFRVDTTVLGPDNAEVTSSERDGQAPAVQNLVREPVRSGVRQVQLTEADEVARLDEASDRALRRLAYCNRTCLLEQ